MVLRTLASSYVANKETGTGQSQVARTGSWRIPWKGLNRVLEARGFDEWVGAALRALLCQDDGASESGAGAVFSL
jgi:hypothetical protein